jgi:multicomponent Na+:H+ antiporter subunit F
MGYVYLATFVMLGLALVVAQVPLIRGDTLPGRVLGLEMTALLIIAAMGTEAIVTRIPAYLDIAIVMALMNFLVAVGFARYLEYAGFREED